RGGVFVHAVVQRGGGVQRAVDREWACAQQVVGVSVRELRDRVRGRGCDQVQLSARGELEVAERIVRRQRLARECAACGIALELAREHRRARERGQRGGPDEAPRSGRLERPQRVPGRGRKADELERLIGGDAAAHAEQDPRHDYVLERTKAAGKPCGRHCPQFSGGHGAPRAARSSRSSGISPATSVWLIVPSLFTSSMNPSCSALPTVGERAVAQRERQYAAFRAMFADLGRRACRTAPASAARGARAARARARARDHRAGSRGPYRTADRARRRCRAAGDPASGGSSDGWRNSSRYSDSPTALRALAGSLNHWNLTAFPSRTVHTNPSSCWRCMPLPEPRAMKVANTTISSPASLMSRTSMRMLWNASRIERRASS